MAEARYKITASDRSNKAIRSARQNLQNFRKSVLNVRTAVVALAGAAAMGAAIKKAADFGDNMDKSAAVAGISVEKLQELRFAFGQLAEVTDAQVDLALQKFRRRLDLARDGTGAAVSTLEKLNISLNQDTGSALEATIAKLQRLSKEQDVAGEASQIFGEEVGPKIATAIEQGNLDELRDRLHEIGGVLSTEAAGGAAELNDKLDELARTLKTQLAEAILSNKDEIVSFVRTIQEGMVEAIKWISRMQRQWDVGKLDTQIEETRRQLELLQEAGRVVGGRGAEAAEIRSIAAEYGGYEEAVAALREQLKKAEDQQMELLTGGGGPSANPFEATGSGDSGTNRELSETLELLRAIDEKRKEMLASGEMTSQSGLSRGGNPLEAFGASAKAANEDIKDLEQSTDQLGFTFSSAFENAIIEGEKLRDVMQGLIKDIQRIILRQTITQPLGNALAESIGSSFGGGKADGGPVTAGRTFLVGERGPELFRPSSSGSIVPNNRLGGGGGRTEVNIINQGGPEPEVSRRRGPGGDVIDVLIPAMQSAVQSGGMDGPMRSRFGLTPAARGR